MSPKGTPDFKFPRASRQAETTRKRSCTITRFPAFAGQLASRPISGGHVAPKWPQQRSVSRRAKNTPGGCDSDAVSGGAWSHDCEQRSA
jgi:hypothetical protein